MKHSGDAGNDPNGDSYSEFIRTDGYATSAATVENGLVLFLDNNGKTQYSKIVFDDSTTDAPVAESSDNEILMVVSNEYLQCRSFQWWAPRAPVAGRLGNLDLCQIATLADEFELNFSDSLADPNFGDFSCRKDVTGKTGPRPSRKERHILKEKRFSKKEAV
jgi:hypothetical protein